MKRLRRSAAEKLRIVEAALEPGASLARVARDNGVNANQLYYWRREYKAGRLAGASATVAGLLPVRVGREARASGTPQRAQAAGAIELEVRQGRLRIEAGADPALLRLVLGHLLA